MELDTQGIGAIARTGQSIDGEAVLELVDVALRCPAVVVPGKDVARPAGAVGDDEADVGPQGRDLDLDENAAAAPPAPGAIAQAGEPPHVLPGALEALLGAGDERCGQLLQSRIAAEADGVGEAVVFEPVVKPRGGETSVGAQRQRDPRRVRAQARHETIELGQQAVDRAGLAATQLGREQRTAAALEDQQRLIDILAVLAVEEAQLLVPVAGVVSRVDVEDQLLTERPGSAGPQEPLERQPLQALDAGPVRGVLEPRHGRLRAQRHRQVPLPDHRLQRGVGAQQVGVVRIFVARNDLVDALAQQSEGGMLDPVSPPPILVGVVEVLAEPEVVVELPQDQQPGVRGQRAAVEAGGGSDLKTEVELGYTRCSHRTSCAVSEAGVEHPLSITSTPRCDGFLWLPLVNNQG